MQQLRRLNDELEHLDARVIGGNELVEQQLEVRAHLGRGHLIQRCGENILQIRAQLLRGRLLIGLLRHAGGELHLCGLRAAFAGDYCHVVAEVHRQEIIQLNEHPRLEVLERVVQPKQRIKFLLLAGQSDNVIFEY